MSAQRVVCVVLPDKKHLDITVGLKSRGQEIIDQLSALLGIKELQLFGLSLEQEHDSDTVCLFLDLHKRLCTYFPKAWKHNTLQERIILHLKVQHYVVNSRQIMGEEARRLYYTDLKGRVLKSQCHWQEGRYFQLTAYALQVDLGDWKEGEGPYFLPQDYFPPWLDHSVLLSEIQRRQYSQGAYKDKATAEINSGFRTINLKGSAANIFIPDVTACFQRSRSGRVRAVLLILKKRGSNYVEQHTPALHRELLGVCESDAVLLFIQEACRLSDVPVTFYSLSKGKKKQQRAGVVMGLTLAGLHVYETVRGEQQLLHELVWSSIDRITFQGKRFEIRADVLPGFKLELYTLSTHHSQHLMKHISSSHRLHLNTRPSGREQHRLLNVGGGQYRELCVRDKNDTETDDSEDELPPLKSLLDRARQLQAKPTELTSNTPDYQLWGLSKKGTGSRSGVLGSDWAENELCVDEPEEMLVDDPDDIVSLTELLEGVSVDGPLTPVSHWIDITMEMKQVLKWRACNLSLDWHRGSIDHLSHPTSCPEEDTPQIHQQSKELVI